MLPIATNGQENKPSKSVMILEIYSSDIKIGLAGSTKTVIYFDNGHHAVVPLSAEYTYFTHIFQQPVLAEISGGKITAMDCSDNFMPKLDVSKNPELIELNCYMNQLKSLDVSKNPKLTILNCGMNGLTDLDVSKNTELIKLYYEGNSHYKLSNLDVRNNTKLIILDCQSNLLTNLDISKNIALTELNCFANSLTDLNINKNTKLLKLQCSNNRLSDLDVSKNTELKELDCNRNQLTSLNVSKNTKLIKLDCSNNKLSEEALNALFATLHNNKNKTEEEKIIYIYGNRGTSTCNKTIAEEKGWKVITEKK